MNNGYKSFQEVFDDCNNVSQFIGSTDKIIDEAVGKLEVIKKTYKEEYQSEEIIKVLKSAEKQLNKNRDTFLTLLRNELDKNAVNIPNNLSDKDYNEYSLKILEHKMKVMDDAELLNFNNSTDEVAVIVAKSMLMDRLNSIENKEERLNMKQQIKMMKPTTRETILNEMISGYNSIQYNSLYPGESFGSSLSKYSQGGIEEIICKKAGIDKAKSINYKNDELSKQKYR